MQTPQLVTKAEDLDELIAASESAPVFLFKHSLTCPISSAAWSRYLSFFSTEEDRGRVRFAAVEIQNARPVSDLVAERTQVRHQSPQALLLDHGEVRWHASHGAITEDSLAEALQAIQD